MKLRSALCVFVFLLLGAFEPCFAEMRVGQITREQARELGIEVRAQPSGPEATWVELQFKAEGRFKDFARVSLEVREGGKLLIGYAPLREERSGDGTVKVRFMVDRAFLEKVTLRIVTGSARNYSGSDLRVRDFVAMAQ